MSLARQGIDFQREDASRAPARATAAERLPEDEMRHLLIRVATITLTVTVPIACARQVEVRTGESPSVATSSIDFTNNLAQAVNVYVRPNSGAGEIFVRQVGPRSHETLSVRGVPPGSSVTLRAAPVDGSVSYTRENVTLGSGFAWQVP